MPTAFSAADGQVVADTTCEGAGMIAESSNHSA